MKMPQHIVVNIVWQENYWSGRPSEKDMQRAGHRYVSTGNVGHEYLNFNLEKDVRDGYKIGYFQATRQPTRFSNGLGYVFFYSAGYIVGVYGQAEIGAFERTDPPPNDPATPGNVRAPLDLVCRFEDIRGLKLDPERHLQGKSRIGQIGFTYIGDDAARAILDDAIALHQGGSEYREKLEDLHACLGKIGDRHSIWKIAPGENASLWDECRNKACIVIGWGEIGDFQQYNTEAELKKALGVSTDDHSRNAMTIWRFTHQLSVGDIVVANKGRSAIVGIGIITSDYIPPGDARNPSLSLPNARSVNWKITEEVTIPIQLPIPTIMPVSVDQWGQVKTAYLRQNPNLAPVFAELEGQTSVQPGDPTLEEIFKTAHNVILYGPPGTGKTYRACRFAAAWTQGQSGEIDKPQRRYWCVVANPQKWHWDTLFDRKSPEKFEKGNIGRNYDAIQSGDLIFGYLASPNRELYCLAKVVQPPAQNRGEDGFYVTGVAKLTKPIPWQVLRSDPLLQNSEPLRLGMRGTLFRLEFNEALHLRELVEDDNPDLADVFDGYLMTKSVEYVRIVTFHQSYGYEDFVEGLRPVLDSDGNVRYEWRPGIFKQICDDAAAEPNSDFILIIDEINRGNIPKIFGELITLLEEDKRLGRDNAMTAILPGSQQRFDVPDNLFVLGTMNTADRSIALLDIALRRRFTFVEVTPDPSLLEGREIEGIPLDALLKRLNIRLKVLLDHDHCLGHSYFMGITTLDQLHFAWYQKIIPLLQEYFYNDGEHLRAVLDDFVGQDERLQNIFTNPPEIFDPESVGYHIITLRGTQFVAALKKLVGLVQ
jgi:5-methylcytosine-specific restriction protein B